ncbi:MAG: MaoC family dehydratase [Chloroflexota bacterium]
MSTGPVEAGYTLRSITRTITQERINAYAEASGDFNPVHLDEEFARNSQFGQRIAHGMLILAIVAEMLGKEFPTAWTSGGRLKARFKAPVFADETVGTYGEVTDIRQNDGEAMVRLKVGCRKEDGTEVITGEASVPIRNPDS